MTLFDPETPTVGSAPTLTIKLEDIDESANAEPYSVGDDSTVEIHAKEQGGTGYIWMVAHSDCGARFEAVDNQLESYHGRNLVGGSKTRIFTFKTPGADSNHIRGLPCDVEFVYTRPWEGENGVVD